MQEYLKNRRILEKVFLVLAVFLALFFVGCTTKIEQECKKYEGTLKSDCIRYYAIMKQMPELCYQIENLEIRKECMYKATEPKEAKKIQAQVEFAKRIEQQINSTQAFEQSPDNLEYQVKQCVEKELKSRDNCLFDIAKNQQNIKICDEIKSEELHRRCIVTLASLKKSAQDCNYLKIEADRQLCLFYIS